MQNDGLSLKQCALDKTFVYEYNNNGCITKVREYAYSTATALTGTPTEKAFTYNTTYPDRLTNYAGTNINYNSIGCPTAVNGYTATWTRSKLSKLSKGSKLTGIHSYNYTYNAFGQRTGKSYSFIKLPSSSSSIAMGMLIRSNREFCYDYSGRLIFESNASEYYGEGTGYKEIVYLYDESGIVGMMYTANSVTTPYYFQRNLLGDVIGIYNTAGTKVAGYIYDAWGNCTITSDTTNYDVAHANSIRYRGYFYDEDTKLYYLNARYYNPEWRRFISPDDTAYLDPESVNGLNLYAYCNNDPVNYCDPSGCFSFLTLALSIGINLVFELVDDIVDGGLGDGSHDWKDYTGAVISGVFGALGGKTATNAVFSIIGSIADAAISGDFEDNGFWNTMGSIVLSSAVALGIGIAVSRVASGIKASSIRRIAKKYGNNVANRKLRAIGATIKIGSNVAKKKPGALSKAIYKSDWIVKDILEILVGSPSGGMVSLGYGYVSDIYNWYF